MPTPNSSVVNDAHPITQSITLAIASVRGQRVILDADLAALYGVETRRLNEQVKRNPTRFPPDFMFQLAVEEQTALRSQIAILKTGRGQHRKYLPYAFTEHGAIMAATLLNSPRAVQVSVYVVRAFVQLRALTIPPDPPKRPIGFLAHEDLMPTKKANTSKRAR